MAKKITRKAVKKRTASPKKKPLKPFKRILKNLKSKIASKSLKNIGLEKPILVPGQEAALNSQSMPAYEEQTLPPGFLPERYGENKLALLVRDPWWLYAYWEVTPDRERDVYGQLGTQGHRHEKTVLRVYDITDTSFNKPNSFFDIEVGSVVGNWYVDVGVPNREWVAELGVRTSAGAFYAFIRSNVVRTPRYGLSEEIDEEWMLLEEFYWKIFGMSGGAWGPKSSLNVREVLERYLKSLRSLDSGSGFRLDSRLTKNASSRSREEAHPKPTVNS